MDAKIASEENAMFKGSMAQQRKPGITPTGAKVASAATVLAADQALRPEHQVLKPDRVRRPALAGVGRIEAQAGDGSRPAGVAPHVDLVVGVRGVTAQSAVTGDGEGHFLGFGEGIAGRGLEIDGTGAVQSVASQPQLHVPEGTRIRFDDRAGDVGIEARRVNKENLTGRLEGGEVRPRPTFEVVADIEVPDERGILEGVDC